MVLAILVGLAFAGSRSELAAGTQVAGVDVGGLTKREAVAKLDALFERRSDDPVEFVAGTESYRLAPTQLAVEPDWDAAVAAASRAGDGFGPLRGFRRLRARVFGAEVLPQLAVSNAALEYALDQIGEDVDREPKNAALVRRGLRFEVAPERTGARLDRDAAAEVIVRSLGQLERVPGATALPVRVTPPAVSAEMLAGAAERARVAVSAPRRPARHRPELPRATRAGRGASPPAARRDDQAEHRWSRRRRVLQVALGSDRPTRTRRRLRRLR